MQAVTLKDVTEGRYIGADVRVRLDPDSGDIVLYTTEAPLSSIALDSEAMVMLAAFRQDVMSVVGEHQAKGRGTR